MFSQISLNNLVKDFERLSHPLIVVRVGENLRHRHQELAEVDLAVAVTVPGTDPLKDLGVGNALAETASPAKLF